MTKDLIVVINLPERRDRRRDVGRELKKIGWDAEIFPAIRMADAGNFPSIGARGCLLSHLAVLKMAEHRNVERLVILEDDVAFSKDLRASWPAIDAFLKEHPWSVFYPAHFRSGAPGIALLPPDEPVLCTHFVIFNGRSIPYIVRELEQMIQRAPGDPKGGPMHVDGAYSIIRKLSKSSLVTFIHHPSLAHQRSSRSDITPGHWADRYPILRCPVALARRIKNSIYSET